MIVKSESNARLNIRNARWLAWSLVALYVILATIGLTLQVLSQTSFGDFAVPVPMLFVFFGVLGLWATIGALIVARHPQHPVGWLLCVGLITPAIDQFATGYVGQTLIGRPGLLPVTVIAQVWLNGSGMTFGILLFTLISLLSPDGRFLSRNWRRVAWIASGACFVYLFLKALEPGPLMLFPSLNNPVGVDDTRWVILNPLMWLALIILVASFLAACTSLILRMRRGRGEERQQVKWLILPMGLFAVGIPLLVFGEHAPPIRVLFNIGGSIHFLAVLSMVIAVAISIFKYRLYDIDIIIRRTLTYSALTGLLALIYFGVVVLLQAGVGALTRERDSPLVTVLSTLAIAALSTPLRRGVQNFINRRFYRQKYDAEQTLAAFANTARDEVDMEQLAGELLGVVETTMQPESASLWLNPTGFFVTPAVTISRRLTDKLEDK